LDSFTLIRSEAPSVNVESALPETGFVRIADVLRVIPVGKSTWWAGVRDGRFPAAVKLTPGVTVWRVEDIRKLIEDAG
jgi:prophage regulatory protein